MLESENLEAGKGRQVSVVLPDGIIRVMRDEAKRRHIGLSTYLRQLIADHAIELQKQLEAA